MITGSTYLLRGQPVVAITQWRQQRRTERPANFPLVETKPTTPRNVLIEHADGRREVRPFRGLRKIQPEETR